VVEKTTDEIPGLVEHLFRHESGKMVAILTRIFGVEHLTLAEDVVQESLIRALQTWAFNGVPDNPSAWIMRTARNLALDVVRRQKTFREKEADIVHLIDQPLSQPEPQVDGEIADDRLRLMFVCCHPSIPADAQIALALKTLGGFSVTEIARAFLTSDAAIAKRLTRARTKIQEAGLKFEIPSGQDLAPRLEGVLHSLYLLFNEGYKASVGDRLVRNDICEEAIRLTQLLAAHPAGNRPQVHALLALMLFNAARFAARLDEQGQLLRLQDQDRSRWDQQLIASGMFHLMQSATGAELSVYHLQAAIASAHCRAQTYDQTNWPEILGLYDQLSQLDKSPIIALNRAVALGNVDGPKAGLAATEKLQKDGDLDNYYLLHAVLGEFQSQLNQPAKARAAFERALALADLKTEKNFLRKRIEQAEH
jgi:RNA polymerase sigma-70 factor (ECF subfamily)